MYTQKSYIHRVADQLLFSKVEVLLIVLLSGAILLFAAFDKLRSSYAAIADIQEFFENDFTTSVSDFLSTTANRFTNADIATMILWAIVGAVVYILCMVAASALRGAKDTVWSTFRFTHPVGHTPSQFLMFSILERAAQFILIFLFIMFSWLFVTEIVPLVYSQVIVYIDEFSIRALWMALYILELAIAIHIWVFLWRLVRGRHWVEG